MKNKNIKPVVKEESLDPLDWDQLKKLGSIMVNDLVDFLQTILSYTANIVCGLLMLIIVQEQMISTYW